MSLAFGALQLDNNMIGAAQVDRIMMGNNEAWAAIPNMFITGGEGGTLAYSKDGSSWTKAAVTPALSNTFHKVKYIKKTIVAISWDGINGFYVSKSGKSFTKIVTPGACYAVAYGAGKWVAAGPVNTFYYSTDLVNWTTVTQPYAGTTSMMGICKGLEFLNNKFVAITSKTSNNYQYAIGSSDGVTWGLPKRATHSDTASGNYDNIVFANGHYMFPADRLDIGYIPDSSLTDTTTATFSKKETNAGYRVEVLAGFEDGSRVFAGGQARAYTSSTPPTTGWSTMNVQSLVNDNNGDQNSFKTYNNTHLFVVGQSGHTSSPYLRYPIIGYYAGDFTTVVKVLGITSGVAYGALYDSAYNGSILVAVGKDTDNSQAYTWRSVGLATAVKVDNTLGNVSLKSVCWAGE